MTSIRHFRPTASVVAAILAAIVALAGVVVVSGGGEQAPVADVLPQESASELATEDAPALESLRVATYEVFLARDPFEPILPDPSPQDGGTSSPTPGTTASPDPTSSATGTPTDGGTGEPAAGGTGCQQSEVVVCEGHTVSLVDVFAADDDTDRAVVQVDSGLYEVAAGDSFATHFRVLSITPPCVTLLYGDDSFTLCEGETVLK